MPSPRRGLGPALAALVSLAVVSTAAVVAHPHPLPRAEHGGRVRADTATVGALTGAGTRPNIVVIMADDMRDDDLRFMPQTRHFFEDGGVRFVNSFSPQPLCCPARASFDTGEYTHNHHVWSHVDPWGFKALDDRSTLPVWLRRVGYNTVFLGKYLNGYGIQPTHWGGPSLRYVPPGWTDWRGSTDGGPGPDSPLAGGTYRYFDTTLNINGRLRGNQGIYQTRMLGDETSRIVKRYAQSPAPFFLWASYVAPHHGLPIEPDDPKPVRRADGTLQTFRSPARPKYVRGKFDSVIRHAPGWKGEADVSDKPFFIRDLPALTPAEQQADTEITRQRAEALSILDQEVGHTIAVLKQTGELDNTLLVFTSDNGYFLGEHRMRQGKLLPYEPSLRVPALIRGPGIPAGQVRTDPITSIDFAPTFLQAAGAQPEAQVDGESLLDVARYGDRGWTRGILTETGPRAVSADTEESDNFLVLKGGPGGPSPLRFSQGVRTRDFLYVEHASHERELYDLRVDEGELTNVVDRPAYARIRVAMAHELDVLRNCAGPSCRIPLPPLLRAP